MLARRIEQRRPVLKPLDLLAQHLITIGLGGGFRAEEMLAEVRGTHAFSQLTDEEWQWTLTFVTTGGVLKAYPQYQKLHLDENGPAPSHRSQDGSHPSPQHRHHRGLRLGLLRLKNGRRLGSVEEWFIAGIRPGKCFVFWRPHVGARPRACTRGDGPGALEKPGAGRDSELAGR
jgi:ATP-dependent Lhr-like helicase